MKLKYNNIIFSIVVIVLFGCGSSRLLKDRDPVKERAFEETTYYKLFTDATKHALFGNYKSAVTLYNACIARFPDRAAPYYQLSSIYIRNNSIPDAKKFAIIAEKLDSTNIWYKLHIANIYQYEANYDSAAIFYEKALKLKDDDDEIKYNLAMLYSQNKKFESALLLLNELYSSNTGSKEILIMRHNVYHEMHAYDSAISELESLTKYFPNDPSSFGMLAEYLTEIGRNTYAKDVYLKMLNENPNHGLFLLSFAEFYLKNNMLDSAFYYYNRALCCSDLAYDQKLSVIVNFISQSDFSNSYNEEIFKLLSVIDRENCDYKLFAAYADLYISLEDYKRAQPYIDSALILEKKNFMLWEQAVLINNFLERHTDVVRISKECLIYFNDKPNIYLIKAYSENELSNSTQALNDIDSLLSLKPQTSLKIQGLNLKADILRNQEKYSESDSCYEEILRLEPENLMIRNNYSYYLSVRGEKLDYAKELSEMTIIKEPKNSTYLDTYGWILYKMGDLKNAKKFIERSIREGAYNNAEVLDHYGDIAYDLNSCTEAIEAWEKAIEISNNSRIAKKLNRVKKECK